MSARVITILDSSGSNDVGHGDLGASPSSFGLRASEELDSGVTVGLLLEYGALGAADKCDDAATCGNSDLSAVDNAQVTVPTNRHAHIYMSGDFGRLAIGQQSTATDGIAYANFNGSAALGGVEVGCDYCSADFVTGYGGGRAQGVKYSTPALGPASVSIFSDANDVWNTMAKIEGSAGAEYQFQAGYGDDGAGTEQTVISGAVGLAMGAHGNFAWGKTNADDSDFVNLGIGYKGWHQQSRSQLLHLRHQGRW